MMMTPAPRTAKKVTLTNTTDHPISVTSVLGSVGQQPGGENGAPITIAPGEMAAFEGQEVNMGTWTAMKTVTHVVIQDGDKNATVAVADHVDSPQNELKLTVAPGLSVSKTS